VLGLRRKNPVTVNGNSRSVPVVLQFLLATLAQCRAEYGSWELVGQHKNRAAVEELKVCCATLSL